MSVSSKYLSKLMGMEGGFVKRLAIIMSMRLATGFLQFLVVVWLASQLSLGDYGIYALLTIYLSYCVLLAGFSFHSFTVRELGSASRNDWSDYVIQHARFLILNTMLVLAGVLLFYSLDLIREKYILYFSMLLIFSSFNNQAENVLIGAGFPLQSTLNLLLRGIWILPVVVISQVWIDQLNLVHVLRAWLCMEVLAGFFMVGVFFRKNLIPGRLPPVDFGWIVSGWKVGGRYTLIGLVFIFTITFQRILLGATHGEESVGVFQFFFALGVFFPNLLEASVYAILLPKLIKENAEIGLHKLVMPGRQLFFMLIAISSIGLTAVVIGLFQLIEFTGKERFVENRFLIVWIALYSQFYFVSRIFHYQLFAARLDQWIARANFCTLGAAIVSSAIFIPLYGMYGAACSLLFTGVAMAGLFAFPFYHPPSRGVA